MGTFVPGNFGNFSRQEKKRYVRVGWGNFVTSFLYISAFRDKKTDLSYLIFYKFYKFSCPQNLKKY